MRRVKVLLLLSALLVAIGLVALFYRPAGQHWVSANGKFTLEQYFERPWRAWRKGPCAERGGFRLRNAQGEVLFSRDRLQPACTRGVAVLEDKFLVLNGAEGWEPFGVDFLGQPARSLSAGDLRALGAMPDTGYFWFAHSKRYDVNAAEAVEEIERQLAAGDELALERAVVISLFVDEELHPKARPLFARLLREPGTRAAFAAAHLEDLPQRRALSLIRENFLSQTDPIANREGLELLQFAENVPMLDRLKVLAPWLDSQEAGVVSTALNFWLEFGGEPERAKVVALRWYYRAKGEESYKGFEHPRDFLQIAYEAGGALDPDLRKAILFGLGHEAAGFWRTAFEQVRDNDDLNSPQFIPALQALKERQGGEPLLGQINETIARLESARAPPKP